MKTKHCITESLNRFYSAYAKARALFNPVDEMNPEAWLTFYESKMTAYLELYERVPEIKQIPEFWRWVQGRSPLEWQPWVEKEVQRIKNTAACPCGEKVLPSQKLCEKCRDLKNTTAKKAKKQRKAVKKRLKAYENSK